MELLGKAALITGSCAEGMGRSTALVLARKGADIVLNYGTHRRGPEAREKAERVAEAIEVMGRRVVIKEADTAEPGQVKGLVDAAIEAFGGVDILVNNAGADWRIRDYVEIGYEEWRKALASEIDATFLLMKYVVPGMRERKWGRIIHLSMDKVLSLQTMKGLAPDYCLGKAARSWMSTAFGVQEFGQGITVNSIEPGLTAHLKFEEALAAAQGDLDGWHGREGVTCHDVALVIAFLCGDTGRFISGSTIRIPTDPS